MIVVRINPKTRTAMKILPFVFGPLRSAVTPGGGGSGVDVNNRKIDRSRYVIVVEAATTTEVI